MNVNLSNVSATSKSSVSDASSKVDAEHPESKGFFETLAGVFTDSQKAEKAVAKSDTPEASTEIESESLKVASTGSEGESQEKVADTVDGEKVAPAESTDELLAQGDDKQMVSSKAGELSDSDSASSGVKQTNSSEGDATPSAANGASSQVTQGAIANQTQPNDADTFEQAPNAQVKSAMGEGQQLLGRIEQANQALKTNESLVDSGKALPPEAAFAAKSMMTVDGKPLSPEQKIELAASNTLPQGEITVSKQGETVTLDADGKPIGPHPKTEAQIDWNSPNTQAMHAEATVNATTQAAVNGQVVTQGAQPVIGSEAFQQTLSADAETIDVKRISIDELHVIDTKLAQGKPLSKQENDIIEGLKTGELIADIPEQELAQFVALPSDVKVAMAEHQAAQHNSRTVASTVTAQQAHQLAAQELKHTTAQVNAQTAATPNVDKAAMSVMPEALAASTMNPVNQAASSAELSKKVMNAGLAAGALKGAANKQDKPEPQPSLAGQIQAAAGQQGVTAQQQTRVDAAQQAQLPLQLTKELANDQVAEKVQMMMSKNLKNLDIRLDPPELGRMQIRMTMNNDLANVHFTVANPQARDLIEQTLPRLREMLAQQGMQLADSSVQQQSSGQQQGGYANADQNGQSGQGRGFSGQSDENFDADVNLDLNVASKRDGISFYA
ncbi:flagellar hook-length control protein FliK [Vibrio sp. 10N.222.52.B12]|uniref:flagellar hook-length control protein FliK n=1 Tax=Vibrio sp. 10N.222.52.B12 TaxID=1880840 RepID=UPI000C81E170|nr:flagellar hook-length control protein FliK [Vibrio sp. 10N.222.52.B12]PMO46174.1 flagellar hook-length control protein FliK [Vibrio sp. 10N.222.52.B12]